MLRELFIENIAVIEKESIVFSKGFNVFTGETGAGKSILIGSINAILGGRISKDLVRTGEKKASVTAVFSSYSSKTAEILLNLGISIEEGEDLILQREITSEGKSSVRIQGRPSTLSMLKEIGLHLINIHGQHDNQDLFSENQHLFYVDVFGVSTPLKESYKETYTQLKETEKELSSMQMDEKEKQNRLDLLSYQIEEIEAAQIVIGELANLEEEAESIRNASQIIESLSKAHEFLKGNDDIDQMGALEALDLAAVELEDIISVFPKVETLAVKIRELFYEMEEESETVSKELARFEFEPNRLNEVEERLSELQRIIRKYGGDEEKVLQYYDEISKEKEKIELSDEEAERLTEKKKQLMEKCQELANQLTEEREKSAKLFCEQVAKELAFLDMEGTTLTFQRKTGSLQIDGQDTLEFLISSNLGEPPKSIRKIASGGELSRIMLSIKNVLADYDEVETLIFDEVDAGVSGRAAEKIGKKLKEASKNRQILCVTHLAQVAAFADEHLLIQKEVRDNRTYTEVKQLDWDGRVREISRIIGGEQLTDTALKHAEEMLVYSLNSEEVH